MNILLVEDDVSLALGIEYALKKEGFNITCVETISKAGLALKTPDLFDIILLDVMLPDGTGFELCRELRKKNDIPVIFLTACDEEANVVMGLDIGGDDYITKPFRLMELISRIKAVGRRKNRVNNENGILKSDEIFLDSLKSKVSKNNEEIILTLIEYKLLLKLMSNPQRVLSRSILLQFLWDTDENFVDDNALSVYIRRLREKIEDNPDKPEYILTVRGSGYKWNRDVR